MMDCAQLGPLYEEFALGVLSGEERAELEAHLARACKVCTPGVEKARWVVAHLSHLAPQAQPPASLKRKMLSAVTDSAAATEKQQAPPSRAVFPAWAWAVAAALALVTGYAVRQMQTLTAQLANLQRQMKVAELQNRALQDQLDLGRLVAAVMMSPASKQLKLMPANSKMPMVHAYLHPQMGVAITAEQMPALPVSRTLQLWSVPKNGQPLSLAIFHPDAQGQVALVAPVTIPEEQIAALAVSEEPAGGSPQPTSTPTWIAQMK
jgi:anti-sigma-K factor RskA